YLHVEDRVHPDRYVVAGDHILRRNVERHDPKRHLLEVGKSGRHEDQARPLGAPEAPEEEGHAALVLLHHPDADERVGHGGGEYCNERLHQRSWCGKASTMTAAPWPPPMQALPRPYRPPRRAQ